MRNNKQELENKEKKKVIAWARPHQDDTSSENSTPKSKIPLSFYSTTTPLIQTTTKKEVPLSLTASQMPKKSWGSSSQSNFGSTIMTTSQSLSQIKKKEYDHYEPKSTLHFANPPPMSIKSPSKPKGLPLFIDPSILAVSNVQTPEISEIDQKSQSLKSKPCSHSQSNSSIISFLESRVNLNPNQIKSNYNKSSENKTSLNSPNFSTKNSEDNELKRPLTPHSISLNFLPSDQKNENIKKIVENSSESNSDNISSNNSQSFNEENEENSSQHSQKNKENGIGLILPNNSNNEKNDIVFHLKSLVHHIQNRPDQKESETNKSHYVPPLFREKADSSVPYFMETITPINKFEQELLLKPKKHFSSKFKTTTKKKEKKGKEKKTKGNKKEKIPNSIIQDNNIIQPISEDINNMNINNENNNINNNVCNNISNNSQFLIDLSNGTMQITDDAIQNIPQINEEALLSIYQDYSSTYNQQIPQTGNTINYPFNSNNYNNNNDSDNNHRNVQRKYHFQHNHQPNRDKLVPLEPEKLEYK